MQSITTRLHIISVMKAGYQSCVFNFQIFTSECRFMIRRSNDYYFYCISIYYTCHVITCNYQLAYACEHRRIIIFFIVNNFSINRQQYNLDYFDLDKICLIMIYYVVLFFFFTYIMCFNDRFVMLSLRYFFFTNY